MRIVPKLYIDGIELSKLQIVQNEKGVFYGLKDKTGKVVDYLTTTIDKFDNYVIPKAYVKKGYKKYIDGSHSMIVSGIDQRKQKPVDISKVGRVTSNVDWLMEYSTSMQGGVCRISSGVKILGRKRYTLFPTHTYKFARAGVVKAGKAICYVNPTYGHMHFWWKRFGFSRRARDFMLLK